MFSLVIVILLVASINNHRAIVSFFLFGWFISDLLSFLLCYCVFVRLSRRIWTMSMELSMGSCVRVINVLPLWLLHLRLLSLCLSKRDLFCSCNLILWKSRRCYYRWWILSRSSSFVWALILLVSCSIGVLEMVRIWILNLLSQIFISLSLTLRLSKQECCDKK